MTDLTSVIVAYFKCNDNKANSSVVDSAGGSEGSLQNADTDEVTEAGKPTSAFHLNGSDESINTNSTFESTFQGSYSMSLWIKPDDGQPAAEQFYIGVKNSTVPVGSNDYLQCTLLTTGAVRFLIRYAGNQALCDNLHFADGAGAWTHLVFTADSTIGGADALLCYINGTLQTAKGNTTGITFADFDPNSFNLYLGAKNSDGAITNQFDGALCNFALFSKVLSQTEVDYLYNSGKGIERLREQRGNLTVNALTGVANWGW